MGPREPFDEEDVEPTPGIPILDEIDDDWIEEEDDDDLAHAFRRRAIEEDPEP